MKLQICHAYGAKGEVMERFFRLKKPALLLAIMSACLFGYPLHFQSGTYREFEAALLSLQWMLLACLSSWCGTFLFLTFSRKDWPLIALLLVSIVQYFTGPVEFSRTTDAVILLACVTLGKSAFVFRELLRRDKGGNNEAHVTRHSSLVTFLVGLVVLLAFRGGRACSRIRAFRCREDVRDKGGGVFDRFSADSVRHKEGEPGLADTHSA